MRGKLKKLLKKQTRESLMLSVVLYGTKTGTMPEEGRYQTRYLLKAFKMWIWQKMGIQLDGTEDK